MDYLVHLQQKEKSSLPISKIKDEVSEMFNNTVGLSTKESLEFFVLVYFLLCKKGERSLLYHLFDKALPKLKAFDKALRDNPGMLKAGQYEDIKSELGITELLKNDVLFTLISALNQKEIYEIKFDDFFEINSAAQQELEIVSQKFRQNLNRFQDSFNQNKIQNEREDPESGQTFDISNSVYHMIHMRSQRTLNLSLQKQTKFKKLESNSPVDILFIQYVDLDLLILIWEKFHLHDYTANLISDGSRKSAAEAAKSLRNIGEGMIGALLLSWLTKLYTDGRSRKVKKTVNAKHEANKAKAKESSEARALIRNIEKDVLNTDENRKNKVAKMKAKLKLLNQAEYLTSSEKTLQKTLERNIKKLENLHAGIEKNSK